MDGATFTSRPPRKLATAVEGRLQQAAFAREKSVRVNRRQAEAGRQSHDRSPVNQSVGLGKMMRPPLGSRANSSMARSNSAASRPPTATNGMANAGMRAWMAPNMPISDGEARSRMAPIRTMSGAMSLRVSSHLPAIEYSKLTNPVIFPPGRARLPTNPAPTGSSTCANTIGIVRVSCCMTTKVGKPPFMMTSGAKPTSSGA